MQVVRNFIKKFKPKHGHKALSIDKFQIRECKGVGISLVNQNVINHITETMNWLGISMNNYLKMKGTLFVVDFFSVNEGFKNPRRRDLPGY
jgi:hypothetical protein